MKKLVFTFMLILSSVFAQGTATTMIQPDFDIIDTNNQHIKIKGTQDGLDIEGAKGKVVFLEFFGHRCPPCLQTIPHLIDIKNKYKDKVEIVTIEVQGLNNEQLKAFAKAKNINYHTISDQNAGNFTNYIAQRSQWQGSIPFMIIIDPQGNVQYIQAGLIPAPTLNQIVDKLLAPNKK